MTSAHLNGHAHPYPGHGRAMRRCVRRPRALRPVAPQEFTLFSDRLDDAREYENTVRDFALVRERVLSADDYNS